MKVVIQKIEVYNPNLNNPKVKYPKLYIQQYISKS